MGTATSIDTLITSWQSNVRNPRTSSSWQLQERCSPGQIDNLGLTAEERELLALYGPDKQSRYCSIENVGRCYSGSAPLLSEITGRHGRRIGLLWILAQLRNLAAFSGVARKLSEEQYLDLSNMILEDYPFMRLTEMMHFFWLFKKGSFGNFYGSVDPIAILKGLDEFRKTVWSRNRLRFLESEARKAAEEKERVEKAGREAFRCWLRQRGKEFFTPEDLEEYIRQKDT